MSISTDSPVSFTSESWRRKLSMVHHNKISDVVVLRLRKTFSAMHLDYWLLGPAANSHSKFRQCLQPEKTHTKLADDISNNIYPVLIIDIFAYLLKTYFWWTMKYNKYDLKIRDSTLKQNALALTPPLNKDVSNNVSISQ